MLKLAIIVSFVPLALATYASSVSRSLTINETEQLINTTILKINEISEGIGKLKMEEKLVEIANTFEINEIENRVRTLDRVITDVRNVLNDTLPSEESCQFPPNATNQLMVFLDTSNRLMTCINTTLVAEKKTVADIKTVLADTRDNLTKIREELQRCDDNYDGNSYGSVTEASFCIKTALDLASSISITIDSNMATWNTTLNLLLENFQSHLEGCLDNRLEETFVEMRDGYLNFKKCLDDPRETSISS